MLPKTGVTSYRPRIELMQQSSFCHALQELQVKAPHSRKQLCGWGDLEITSTPAFSMEQEIPSNYQYMPVDNMMSVSGWIVNVSCWFLIPRVSGRQKTLGILLLLSL